MIFVDKENKELLEQHLDGFATWMPYGFGEKGMLGLYPTNDHSEDEIIAELKKYNIPYYTEATEAVILDESGNDSADEAYKGIFIDRKTGDFKILTGRFPDKKAMINKYGTLGKDYIARKVFEKPVFDWILNNAKSSLDSYLMFSTAFSKWKDNSILDKYYMKLINDMPQLFKNVRAQDKIGGSNKAKGSDKESVDMKETPYNPTGEKKNLRYYAKTFDKDNNLLVDYGKEAYTTVQYYPDIKDSLYQNIDLWKTLQDMVKDTEEETGKEVAYITVEDKPDDRMSKNLLMSPTREEIFAPHKQDVGYIHADEYDPNDPMSRGVNLEIYCKNEKGQKIGYKKLPMNIRHNLDQELLNDENAIIDNYKVWHTALEVLNTAGQMEDKDQVYIVNPKTGKEMACNRFGVETNVHNMDPRRMSDGDYWMTKPKDKKTGEKKEPKPRHSTWGEVNAKTYAPNKDLSKQQLDDLLKFMNRNKEVDRRDLPNMSPSDDSNNVNFNLADIDQVAFQNRAKNRSAELAKIMPDIMGKAKRADKKIDPAMFDFWKNEWVDANVKPEDRQLLRRLSIGNWPKEYYDKITKDQANADIYYHENADQEVVREEVKDLVKASGIYDLPDYPAPTNTVTLRAKNDLGKDDVETLTVDINSDNALEQIRNAAQRLKDRNLGKQIMFQIDDEPEEVYGL